MSITAAMGLPGPVTFFRALASGLPDLGRPVVNTSNGHRSSSGTAESTAALPNTFHNTSVRLRPGLLPELGPPSNTFTRWPPGVLTTKSTSMPCATSLRFFHSTSNPHNLSRASPISALRRPRSAAASIRSSTVANAFGCLPPGTKATPVPSQSVKSEPCSLSWAKAT